MLGGGLLPGTLTVIYGATGIGKTHLGLTFADHGRVADGARGVVFDMNGRGDSQQHRRYAERLFGWPLRRVDAHRHADGRSVPAARPDGRALLATRFPWVGRVRDYQVPTPDGGWEFDWNWKATYNHALYTVRPFLYFHFATGSRRVVVDGVEPMDVAGRLHPGLHLRRAVPEDHPPRRRDAGDGDLPAGVAAPRVHRRAPATITPPSRPCSWSPPRRRGSRTCSPARWRRATSARSPTPSWCWGASGWAPRSARMLASSSTAAAR